MHSDFNMYNSRKNSFSLFGLNYFYYAVQRSVVHNCLYQYLCVCIHMCGRKKENAAKCKVI